MINRDWFKKHLMLIKQQAGARYTPELNIKLPISEIFDGISRTRKFYIEIREKHGDLIREFRRVNPKHQNTELQELYNIIEKDIRALSTILNRIKSYDTVKIPYKSIYRKTDKLYQDLWNFIAEIEKEKQKVEDIKLNQSEQGKYIQSPSEQFGSTIHYLHKTLEAINFFRTYSTSEKAKLSNKPFLLLTGSAGTGKTHLLCDIAEHRINTTSTPLPTFMTLGEFFTTREDFWKQIIKLLKLNPSVKSKKSFLNQLDKLGKKSNSRCVLIVDALNENITQNPNYWKRNLNAILKDLKNYPNIAFIVSIRNGFENETLTKKQQSAFTCQEHQGFLYKEWEAITKFFEAFSLPLPEVPLLMPEFQNPLFLLLFCKAFSKRKVNEKKQIFRGHEGATYIFENYIDTISNKIEEKFKISHGAKNNIWDTVIEKIAEEMVNVDKDRIPEERLVDILKQSHPLINTGALMKELESNLLIVKIPNYTTVKAGFDIRFPFQKFSDHLMGRYIFKKYEKEFGKSNKNFKTARQFFSKRRRLGKFLSESWNRGIIETLSIQCPEQLKGIEFIEVVPYLNKNFQNQLIQESFIESLIWRNPKAFSFDLENTLSIINKSIIKTKAGHEQLLNAFLSVAPVPNHPFNAFRLHNHLIRLSMPVRDSWWSTFLHDEYGSKSAIDRLLEWSLSKQDKSYISDESIFLTCIALTWFLTTPNRFVRDKATKGLVCILQHRINLLQKILEFFEKVNDPYVSERLYAVGYGSVLRNHGDFQGIRNFAEWVYKRIFLNKKPPIHILLRDYARGIIEVANKKCNFKINFKTINPPYMSKWPSRIPSRATLKKKYYRERTVDQQPDNRDYLDIWFSVFDGDFSRYVIGTNSWSCEWSGRRMDKINIDLKKLFKQFKSRLANKQRELLDQATNEFYGQNIKNILEINFIEPATDKYQKKFQESKKRLRKKLLLKFENSLKETDKDFFRKEIKPFLNNHGSIDDPLETFDLRIAQRWIFKRVIELGYNPTLHGDFDRIVNRYDNSSRSEHKAERIGKKYQWIAYYEFMALLSDHFEFKGDSWSNSKKIYKGPWDPKLRDIDPTFVFQIINAKLPYTFSIWENSVNYDSWDKNKSSKRWLLKTDNIPNPIDIIKINDDGKKSFLVLNGFIEWEEKTPPEFKRYDIPVRQLWYMLKSYIVKTKDLKKIYNWCRQGIEKVRMLPESHSFYEIFLAEYPNSIAFKDLRGNYNYEVKSDRYNELPDAVTVTDDCYANEFSLDCSHDSGISIKLPCKWLTNELKLSQINYDGNFYDSNGKLTVFSKSLIKNSSPALLIDFDTTLNYLNQNGYSLLWTLISEKRIISDDHSRKDYAGLLEIFGVYFLNKNGSITGKIKSNFIN